MATDTPSLNTLLKKDETVLRFFRMLEAYQQKTNFERIETESAALHAGRTSPSLSRKSISVSSLLDANARDVSARSRLVELYVLVVRTRDSIDVARDSVSGYIHNKYRLQLKERFGTDAATKRYVARLMDEAIIFTATLDSLASQLNKYIEDIDKAGYALRNKMELLRMQLGPSGGGSIS